MKVAFDENIPIALVRVFKQFANERQFRFLTAGLTIESAHDYTPVPGDADYQKNSDVPWVKRFAAAGGRVIITGDTEMKNAAHERLALIEAGMIVVFFEKQWSQWDFWQKCALLLFWWGRIAKRVKRARKGSFCKVPCNWQPKARLLPVSNKDAKKLKIERQLVAKGKPRRRAAIKHVPRKPPRPIDPSQGSLELVHDGKQSEKAKGKIQEK